LAAPLMPEFLGIFGTDVFLVLSILACLFDLPVLIQYIYHISAYIGFLQLWLDYIFAFSEETRFLICVAYLVIGLANIIFLNGYIGARDRKILWTTSFLCSVTVPSTLIGFSAVSWYVNRVAIALPSLPLIPPEAIAAILLLCGIILAISLILSAVDLKLPSSSVPKKRKGGVK
jgi:hypothetical protein